MPAVTNLGELVRALRVGMGITQRQLAQLAPVSYTHLDVYKRQRKDRPLEATRQVVWSLLTSSEFRFNY